MVEDVRPNCIETAFSPNTLMATDGCQAALSSGHAGTAFALGLFAREIFVLLVYGMEVDDLLIGEDAYVSWYEVLVLFCQ